MKVVDMFDGEVDEPDMAEETLPAGTVVQKNGIPLELVRDTVVRTHSANVALIRDVRQPDFQR